MKNMLFKSILIADIQKKTARFVPFKKGLNVITSSENHVGKSSVIKSLYYTLGAEVGFDDRWDKSSKLTIVTIDVDGVEYRVVRFLRRFAVLKDNELILLSDSVTHQLAPKLAELFDFSVYLAEKQGDKRVVQAPPAFTFMPYYIDQDNGWSELYGSFKRMDQFSRSERAKSLYFHLGIYTKDTIRLQAQKDRLKEEKSELQKREQQLITTIFALSEEVNSIIPAENEMELEEHLALPKEEIEILVKKIGQKRNLIQKLQTSLEQHESQLDIIKQFQQIKAPETSNKETIHTCPNCGYELDNDLYKLVRNNYNRSNSDYLRTQIEFVVNNIKTELISQEQQYIDLLAQLKENECVFDETRDAFDVYLQHRGLKETLRKYQIELGKNRIDQGLIDNKVKEIDKDLKKLSDKKEIEQCYISHVKENIMALGAWTKEYDGSIKLLNAIKAQGSLMPKIILSQYNGLFQTMAEIKDPVIRFPFVVDSPRNMEPSVKSSKDILKMIAKISCLPQVIVATVDYDEFGVGDECNANRILFTDEFSLLNEESYSVRYEEVEGLFRLMKSEDSNYLK